MPLILSLEVYAILQFKVFMFGTVNVDYKMSHVI